MPLDIDHHTVMKQPIQYRRNEHLVLEQFGPFRKGLVGSDDRAGLFITVGHKTKKQIAFITVNWCISHLIHNHQGGLLIAPPFSSPGGFLILPKLGNQVLQLYEIDPGDLQVSLPEPAFDFRLPPEQPAENPLPDPHGLAGIRQSIENGRPDKEVVVQWILAQRKAQPPPSYKKLAAILNDAKIPTLSGRDAWSRSTLRNLAVRAEVEQEGGT